MVSADDLVQYANARVDLTNRLLGGVVFVDNLYKDPMGRLFMSLEKYDTTAQGTIFKKKFVSYMKQSLHTLT